MAATLCRENSSVIIAAALDGMQVLCIEIVFDHVTFQREHIAAIFLVEFTFVHVR